MLQACVFVKTTPAHVDTTQPARHSLGDAWARTDREMLKFFITVLWFEKRYIFNKKEFS